MDTKEHFKTLYDVFKDDGLLAAAKYDLQQTLDRGYVQMCALTGAAAFAKQLVTPPFLSAVELFLINQPLIEPINQLLQNMDPKPIGTPEPAYDNAIQ